MSDDTNSKPPKVLPAEAYAKVSSDKWLEMFKEWCLGKSYEKLSEEYGVPVPTISLHARTREWRKYRTKYEDRRYKSAIGELRGQASKVIKLIGQDLDRLIGTANKESRELNKDERQYMLNLLDRQLKEIRLEDNKPTDITGGTVTQEIRLKLPHGVRPSQFGIIPPDNNVIMIESPKEKEIEAPGVDLDALEENQE